MCPSKLMSYGSSTSHWKQTICNLWSLRKSAPDFSPTWWVICISQLYSLSAGGDEQVSAAHLGITQPLLPPTAPNSLQLQGHLNSAQLWVNGRVCPEEEKNPWRYVVCSLARSQSFIQLCSAASPAFLCCSPQPSLEPVWWRAQPAHPRDTVLYAQVLY